MCEKPQKCSLLSLIDTVKRCSDAGKRFCFILGAGASVSSKINSGEQMAKQWFDDLKRLEPKVIDEWIEKYKVDENDIGRYYSNLYEIRFNKLPLEGYIWLQNAMKNAKPSLGYYHLANILSADKTSINLVITTNFDSLTEDAIFMYTDKKPQVVTHELLAPNTDVFANRPIIAKIHRDLMFYPISSEDGIQELAKTWEPVLKKALDTYTPIVMGYGGNDGSLMKLLEKVVKENGTEKPIFWCHKHGEPPKNERILKLLNACGGFLVPITDFDTAMYLFGVEFGHNFSEESVEKRIRERINRHFSNRKEIDKGKIEIKQLKGETLNDDEKAVIDAFKKSVNNEIEGFSKEIDENPKKATAYYNRGKRYFWADRCDDAIKDLKKAIQLEPNNAKYHSFLGLLHTWRNNFEEAVKEHTEAIKIAPDNKEFDSDNAEYYSRRAGNFNRLNKYKEEVDDYKKAIELDPDNVRYHARLSYALYKTGERDEAIFTVKKAIKLDEDETLCHSNHGMIKLKIAKRDKQKCQIDVLNDFKKAIAGPYYRLHVCYTDLAEYYLYIGKNEESCACLQQALKVDKKYGRAWYYLAMYYDIKGDSSEYERCMVESEKCKFIPDDDDLNNVQMSKAEVAVC